MGFWSIFKIFRGEEKSIREISNARDALVKLREALSKTEKLKLGQSEGNEYDESLASDVRRCMETARSKLPSGRLEKKLAQAIGALDSKNPNKTRKRLRSIIGKITKIAEQDT